MTVLCQSKLVSSEREQQHSEDGQGNPEYLSVVQLLLEDDQCRKHGEGRVERRDHRVDAERSSLDGQDECTACGYIGQSYECDESDDTSIWESDSRGRPKNEESDRD